MAELCLFVLFDVFCSHIPPHRCRYRAGWELDFAWIVVSPKKSDKAERFDKEVQGHQAFPKGYDHS